MENGNRHDLQIAGSGSAAGGVYQDVKINGSGSINGDVDCMQFKINGRAEVVGNVKSDFTNIHGETSVTGNLQSNHVQINGSATIGGNLGCHSLKVNGGTTVKGSVTGDSVSIKGDMAIYGDCEAESFTAKGGFQVGGLLNAGTIEIDLHPSVRGCRVKEMGGEKIIVRSNQFFSGIRQLIKTKLFDSVLSLSADTVEGDDIYLENTKAKVVRGNHVRIGPGCEIELVEYKHTFEHVQETVVRAYYQV